MQLNMYFNEKYCVRWLVIGVNITVVTKEIVAYFYILGTQNFL